jgi:hypothetical protein
MWKRRGKEYRESLHRRAAVPPSYVMSKTEAEGLLANACPFS